METAATTETRTFVIGYAGSGTRIHRNFDNFGGTWCGSSRYRVRPLATFEVPVDQRSIDFITANVEGTRINPDHFCKKCFEL